MVAALSTYYGVVSNQPATGGKHSSGSSAKGTVEIGKMSNLYNYVDLVAIPFSPPRRRSGLPLAHPRRERISYHYCQLDLSLLDQRCVRNEEEMKEEHNVEEFLSGHE
jgi:hypothetical protein